MIESQLLTQLVNDPTALRKFRRVLRTELFINYPDVWKLVSGTLDETDDAPTWSVIEARFGSFFMAEPNTHSVPWLVDKLTQEFLATKIPALRKILTESTDRRAAMRQALLITRDLALYLSPGRPGIDLADPEYCRSYMCGKGNIRPSVTTGFSLLDSNTGGSGSSDFEIYFGRPGEGKTLVLLYGAYRALLQGKRVLFISPEMSRRDIILRLDSMRFHFSNRAMIGGQLTSSELKKLDAARASEKLTGFVLHADRRFSTAEIASIIARDEPDMVCIDGLLLIDCAGLGSRVPLRMRVATICEELRAINLEARIPMRVTHQANRESERVRNRFHGEFLPDLHHLAESSAVEHHATLVVAVRYSDDRMFFAVRKNRHGPNCLTFSARWDIDRGYVGEEMQFGASASTAAQLFDFGGSDR